MLPGDRFLRRQPTMNVSLTPELEAFVSRKVESGLYQTASEVVREGLRLLRERDELHQRKLDELRKEIALGIEQADAGKLTVFNKKAVERIKARGRERLAQLGTKRT
jgi:antitoxin ParD1/3/4